MDFTLDDLAVLKVKVTHHLTRNISKTVTDTRLDPGRTFLKVAMSFRLAPSELTLDDLEGSKMEVIYLT